MDLLRPHFCTEESWKAMPEESKRQMLVVAASIAPVSILTPRLHDPGQDGPFGAPFERERQILIDPSLGFEQNV